MKSTKYTILLLSFMVSAFMSHAQADITLNARVYLEGSLIDSYETGETHGRVLMRDNLRNNPFTNTRVIPNADIYQTPLTVNDYTTIDVTSHYEHVACGALPQYATITSPFSVFAVTGENAIVDWVFVELRAQTDNTSVIATRSGLLQRDGDIVDLDGVSALTFPGVPVANYFVAIRHRNHLGAMTAYAQTPEVMANLVDFSSYNLFVYDKGDNGKFDYTGMAMKEMQNDVRALWAGDFNSDGKICYHGKFNDLTVIHQEVAAYDMSLNPMFALDFNNATGYLQGDFDMNGKTKFDNPTDDTNQLFGQILFYDLNSNYFSNFAHMVEQLP